jgi:hypothetical protein
VLLLGVRRDAKAEKLGAMIALGAREAEPFGKAHDCGGDAVEGSAAHDADEDVGVAVSDA